MDTFINLVRVLYSLDDETDNMTFSIHFMRVMNHFMSMRVEILFEAREQRDTNEFYELIFANIGELRRYMTFYIHTVMRGEQLDMRQLFALQRTTVTDIEIE